MPFTQCSIFLNKDNILFCNVARPKIYNRQLINSRINYRIKTQ